MKVKSFVRSSYDCISLPSSSLHSKTVQIENKIGQLFCCARERFAVVTLRELATFSIYEEQVATLPAWSCRGFDLSLKETT